MSQDFRDLIRTIRKGNGLSQGDLAKRMNLSSGQIVSNWERGYGAEMKIEHFQKFLKIFKLNKAELFDHYLSYRKQLLAERIQRDWKKISDY